MDVFIPDREPALIFDLIAKLRESGVHGRDAAFLASVRPCASWDAEVRANYLAEFRFMVAPENRPAVAALLELESW